MKGFLLSLIILTLPMQAAALSLHGIVDRIDYLYAEDRHRTSYVWDGRIRALNGDHHDVQALYTAKRPTFNAKLAIRMLQTPRFRLSVPLHMDNGFKADLYEARAYLGGGLIAQWAQSPSLTLGLHLHDLIQIGGRVTERPCHDGFQRRFHCGTGLPWTDAAPHLRHSNVSTFGQVTVKWRF